jgi:hypothetical protein
MAKSMIKGLQNDTHLSKQKWADPKFLQSWKLKTKHYLYWPHPFAIITLA